MTDDLKLELIEKIELKYNNQFEQELLVSCCNNNLQSLLISLNNNLLCAYDIERNMKIFIKLYNSNKITELFWVNRTIFLYKLSKDNSIYFCNIFEDFNNNKKITINEINNIYFNYKYKFLFVILQNYINVYKIIINDDNELSYQHIYKLIFENKSITLFNDYYSNYLYIINPTEGFNYKLKIYTMSKIYTGYIKSHKLKLNSSIKKIKVNNDFSFLIILNTENKLLFYDLIDNNFITIYDNLLEEYNIIDFDLSFDGRFIIFISKRFIFLFDIRSNFNFVKKFEVEHNSINPNDILQFVNSYKFIYKTNNNIKVFEYNNLI